MCVCSCQTSKTQNQQNKKPTKTKTNQQIIAKQLNSIENLIYYPEFMKFERKRLKPKIIVNENQ